MCSTISRQDYFGKVKMSMFINMFIKYMESDVNVK